MIAFSCPSCKKKLSVKDELAGKKIKCPGCQSLLGVPQAGTATLARQVQSASANLAEERTLPPRAKPGAEELTLPPKSPSQTGTDSLSSSVDPTSHGATQGWSGGEPSRELYDFLSPPQAADEIGRLGPFRVLKVLGAGGMGVVYKAEDPQLQRPVALKAMLPTLGASESARKRFLREAQAAARLAHDHIVPILQVGEDRGVPFIAMQFLEGEALDERLKREGRLSVAEVLRIGRETAEGLAAAHEMGLIHRDIKPANIWLEGKKARVKILDFGLARAASDDAHLTQTGAILGTPAYMAPEQAGGEKVDPRCDLFSLGCVLYRLCTGAMPFKGKDSISTLVAVATENPAPPAEINPEVPPDLSALVMTLLAKNPAERPQSAHAVAEALQNITPQTAEIPARPGSKTKTFKGKDVAPNTDVTKPRIAVGNQKPKRNRSLVLMGGAVLGLGILAAVIVLFWQTPHGLVKIESDDPSIEIVFMKDGPTIKGAGKDPITIRSGEYSLLVKRGDFQFETNKLFIGKGKTITLKVELLAGKIQVSADGRVIGADEPPLAKTFTNSLGMEFVLVPKGKSWLGGGGGKWGLGDKELEILHDFYLGMYEVTQEEWEKVMGSNPSVFQAVQGVAKEGLKRFPVENVSWEDAQEFIKRLNKKEKEAGWVYSLPKEAEWEYACRGGPGDKLESEFHFYFEKPANHLLPEQANFGLGTGLKRTCKVGSYKPNRLGLYDMHGNVWEWCEDLYDPKDSRRVHRGGGWNCDPGHCTAALRNLGLPSHRYYDLGLRLARVPVGKEIVKVIASEEKKPPVEAKLPPTFTNGLGMEFVLVSKGKSWLGGGGGKPGDKEVEIKHNLYLGKYEVTQEEWHMVTGLSPSHFSRTGAGKDSVKDIPDEELKRFPVELVSWPDTQLFLDKLNKREKKAGWVYRLPTEVEWEYACRGGPMADKSDSAFDYYFEKPTNDLLPNQANFEHGIGLKRTCKVGSYQPNRLGLYDMHGNVVEWCHDSVKVVDGVSFGLFRGASWANFADVCRAATRIIQPRSARGHGLGLRVALVPIGKEIVKSDVGLPPSPPAVVEKGVLDYAAIHDADEKRFDAWIAAMKKDKLRPISLSVQTVKDLPRFSAVAVQEAMGLGTRPRRFWQGRTWKGPRSRPHPGHGRKELRGRHSDCIPPSRQTTDCIRLDLEPAAHADVVGRQAIHGHQDRRVGRRKISPVLSQRHRWEQAHHPLDPPRTRRRHPQERCLRPFAQRVQGVDRKEQGRWLAAGPYLHVWRRRQNALRRHADSRKGSPRLGHFLVADAPSV